MASQKVAGGGTRGHNSQAEADEGGGEDVDEERARIKSFVRKEQDRIRKKFFGDEAREAPEGAARFADEGFSRGRMSAADLEAFYNFTMLMDYNESRVRKVWEAGDNPYYVNCTFGAAGEPETVEGVVGTELGQQAAVEDEDEGPPLPDWDGNTRLIGQDGEVYIADTSNLEHVDEMGFDKDGGFYPYKDLGDERFVELLNRLTNEDADMLQRLDEQEDAEVEATGDCERRGWRKYLDEDGFLRPDCLLRNSSFLQENPWVDPKWVVPSPTPLRWRGDRIDAAKVGGAVAEWDILCNSDYAGRSNTFTALRHTGVGCTLLLPHISSGWVQFQCAPEEQIYFCTPHVNVFPATQWREEELALHIVTTADDVEAKVKSTHVVAGQWRLMLHGPRVVVWNARCPEMEIHLTHDGFMVQGDSGRCMWVRADAVDPDRFKQYFINTFEALRVLRVAYCKTLPSIWEYVPTENDFGEECYMKVMRHEEAPDPRLRWLDQRVYNIKCKLEDRWGVAHDYDRQKLEDRLWRSRAEAARLRNGTDLEPDMDQLFYEPVDGFNEVFGEVLGLSPYTPGKGSYNERGEWVDDPRFTNVPQYRRRLLGVDNAKEEQRHFARLEELRRKRRLLADLHDGATTPAIYAYKFTPAYGSFDAAGLPTHHRNGTAISEGERRRIEAEVASHREVHKSFKEVEREVPSLMHRLAADIEDLQRQVNLYDPFEATVDDETADLSHMGMHPHGPDDFGDLSLFNGELRLPLRPLS